MRISLFITHYNDTLFSETGKAIVRVLKRLGHTVEFRGAQTCCGQLHFNTGYQADAVAMMQRFVEVFNDAEVICVPSASCVAMMPEHYPKMAAARVAQSVTGPVSNASWLQKMPGPLRQQLPTLK